MDVFESVLDKVRYERQGLFDPRALKDDQPRPLRVSVITIPTQRQLEDLRREVQQRAINDNELEGVNESIWEDLQPESEALEDSDEARKQREPYGQRRRQVDVELLAVYRPFHLYPKGDWGVLFFERSVMQFCRRLLPYFHSLGYSSYAAERMIVYAIARHEFTHYLNELKTLELEMLKGGQVFLPYLNSVYKATYPNADCSEETVACFWQWDNTVMRSPAGLRKLWRKVIQSCPFPAYSEGASLDSEDVRRLEDRLLAQSNYCAVHPHHVPVVWGALPRPYVQPWTRYENVDFMMTQSGGGTLASQLNAGPIRKTIQIYHV